MGKNSVQNQGMIRTGGLSNDRRHESSKISLRTKTFLGRGFLALWEQTKSGRPFQDGFLSRDHSELEPFSDFGF
jgi:hypothetical protein